MISRTTTAPVGERVRHRTASVSWRPVIAASASLVLTMGCVSPVPLTGSSESTSFEVKFVDSIGDPMTSHDKPVNAYLHMGGIGGATVGMPNGTLQSIRISNQSSVEIRLGTLEVALSKVARPITKDVADYLTIVPSETRFARASTLLSWNPPPDGTLSVAFLARDDTKKSLGLFYFDRPCRLSGVHTSGTGATIVYDMTVKKPGLTWVVSSREGQNKSVMRVAQSGTNPIMVVAPPNNVKDGTFEVR
jgi:hypothetical protein